MSIPILYRSGDASAPTLSGVAGSLVSVLDACLVNGYGSKAAAGWTKAFTASNQASYRQAAGNQFYLDVDDRGASGVLTGTSGQEAAVRGYEAMSAVSTGTNPFPTAVQSAIATGNWRKANSTSALGRPWWLIADDRTFIIGIATLDTNSPTGYHVYYFGDIYSTKSGDGFRTAIVLRSTQVNTAGTTGTFGNSISSSAGSTSVGAYAARVVAATGTSVNIGIMGAGNATESAAVFNSGGVASNDGYAQCSRWNVTDTTTPHWRGWLRGIWSCQTPSNLSDGDTFQGVGDLAGRSFVVCKNYAGVSSTAIFLETTTWDTSS